MKKALIIIAKKGFQDHEYEGTRKGLEDAGFEIEIASTASGTCTGKFGAEVIAQHALVNVHPHDFDRIGFIGGPGAGELASDSEALRIAHEAVREDVVLGAICIAPTILAKAHVLAGKNATVWDSGGEQIAILEQYGANYTGELVTVDGKIVTGNGPDAAEEFGKTLAAL